MRKLFSFIMTVVVFAIVVLSVKLLLPPKDTPPTPSPEEKPVIAPYSTLPDTPLTRMWLENMSTYKQLWAEKDYQDYFLGKIEIYDITKLLSFDNDIYEEELDSFLIKDLLADVAYLYNFWGTYAFECSEQYFDLFLQLLNDYTLFDIDFGNFVRFRDTNIIISDLFSLDKIFAGDIKLENGNYYSSDGSSLIRWTDKDAVNIVLPKQVKTIASHAFTNCASAQKISWKGKIYEIGNGAFRGCSNLRSMTIPAQSTIIPAGVFYDCLLLQEIAIPESIEYIGPSAFRNSGITDIIFSGASRLEYISAAAFRDCRNLTEIILPQSVTSLGDSAFTFCSNLRSITLPQSITAIPYYLLAHCTNLKDISIPEGVVSIGDKAFANCGIESISLPASIKTIGNNAFLRCLSLKQVSFALNSDLEEIGDKAFEGCLILKKVTGIPPSATIKADAFLECYQLEW